MAKQSSVNLDITNNADGFDISGGTTSRKLTVSGADVSITGSGTATVTFPSTTTTLAGLGITQAFTAFQSFNAGVSALSGTFVNGLTSSSNLNLQNSEFIQNTTNGRVDIMPRPTGSTAYGIYFDMTSWGFGVVMGTVRSSDDAINTGGNFRFDVPVTISADTRFQLGSDGHYGFYRTDTGNNTGQIFALSNNANNSGAIALVGYFDVGAANRSPGTTHVNPNFYIYANGTTSANDFVRFEHDRTNANIVTGGTSGIFVQPGSGLLGVSGGVSADAFILSSNGIKALTGTTYTFLATDNGEIITMNNASGITASIPSGLPVGFSVTVIQLGAGQVGFTAGAAGVTLNSYTSLRKIAGQHGSASLVSYASNVYNLAGNLA